MLLLPPPSRIHNWGSRIDLILAGGLTAGQPQADQAAAAGEPGGQQQQQQQPPWAGGDGSGVVGGSASGRAPAVWVAAGDIWPEQQGSDHCPVWADFAVVGDGPFPCAATGKQGGVCWPPERAMYAAGAARLQLLLLPLSATRSDASLAAASVPASCCSAACCHALRFWRQAAEAACLAAARRLVGPRPSQRRQKQPGVPAAAAGGPAAAVTARGACSQQPEGKRVPGSL